MVKGEWNYIRHNRLILISVLAIMFIPFLYSIFFLRSVWDPYGETSELPVAVVNQDKAVTYQGKTLNVGNQTIKNLKKNDQLGWHFVSANQAAQGLKDHKYYTVITIPENFSKNAATALDSHPKKMTFTYKTNASANYIAKVMSDVGADKLKSEISAKVTKAYAQATFDQIYKVGKGMNKAAKGSTQLKDGTVTLTDGLNTYTTGVKTLNNGLQQMKTSVTPLATGIQKLSTGADTLKSGLGQYTAAVGQYTSGVGQYTSGVNQFTAGVSQLGAGMPKLMAGANQLDSGAQSLNKGVYQYVDGVYTLNTGVKRLGNGVGPLADGVSKLYSGSTSLSSGLSELSNNSSSLTNGASTLANGASQVSQGVSALQSQLDSMMGGSTMTDIAQVQSMINDINTLNANGQLTQLKDTLTPALTQLVAAERQMNQAMAAEKSAAAKVQSAAAGSSTSTTTTTNSADKNAAAETKSAIAAAQANVSKASSASDDSAKDAALSAAQSALKQAESQNAKISGQATQSTKATDSGVSAAAAELLQAQKSVVAAGNNLQSVMTGVVSTITQNGGIDATTANALSNLASATQGSKLNELSGKLNQLGSLSAKTADLQRLVKGANDLSDGATTLNEGMTKYASGVDAALAGSKQLNTGLGSLNAQIPTLKNGITQIMNGTAKLASNGAALKSGSSQLANGTGTLTNGLQTAAAGVNKLNANTGKLSAAGNKLNSASGQLNSASGQLTSGAGQLSSGLQTLNSKVPTLTSGVNQLADGSAKLDANSNKLMQGTNKLKDGSGQLASSLKAGADQINSQPLTDRTAAMFAAPTKLKHENYSYVPNYGHALAPYVLSVALYVGALVFNFAFPIRKVSMAGGSVAGWYWSKLSIGAVEAFAMAVIEPSLMMLGGLTVTHPLQLIILSIAFSEASMFIVMFLSMLLDNPGRFIAMVLLMLQLGGSGGTFPMEVTNHFYNVVHPFLPMTYSILGFRQAITDGMGSGVEWQAVGVLALFAFISMALLYPTMRWLQKKHLMGESQLDDNQKLQAVEDPTSKRHS
ncbi:YhgE/Pip domain-containing protein [Levilactobacillus namurensis]|uniref:YhgE/Pip domain-containing protein n=1 Tax=Levilactobacillus namurensis TaxID=380393 RepID=UPI001DB0E2DD|nr:YhgE/Pip domain-containing protein [Levilactobacillus namurensis]HJE45240.1 YhgE/Pip domain-containing protein [Levilactobacillus namurensis]